MAVDNICKGCKKMCLKEDLNEEGYCPECASKGVIEQNVNEEEVSSGDTVLSVIKYAWSYAWRLIVILLLFSYLLDIILGVAFPYPKSEDDITGLIRVVKLDAVITAVVEAILFVFVAKCVTQIVAKKINNNNIKKAFIISIIIVIVPFTFFFIKNNINHIEKSEEMFEQYKANEEETGRMYYENLDDDESISERTGETLDFLKKVNVANNTAWAVLAAYIIFRSRTWIENKKDSK